MKLPVDELNTLTLRCAELEALMAQSQIIANQTLYQRYHRERSAIEKTVMLWQKYQKICANIKDNEALLMDHDVDIQAMAKEEVSIQIAQRSTLEHEIILSLVAKDPDDDCDIFLEVRAGTGGHEACLFAGDLFRMYTRYAEIRGFTVTIIASHDGEHGGYKSIIAQVSGNQVFADFKYESGTHRVQRIPHTESQGRIHTSACTVAVLPQAEITEGIELENKDLRIDTYRSSGAGGQHVNTTDSAVRITHLPTGLVAECQDERSQHKNKAKALKLLQTRVIDAQKREQQAKVSNTRKAQIGSGDRSERIRTYNFPQSRITDHRIQTTWQQLTDILSGRCDIMIQALKAADQTQKLVALQNQHDQQS